MTFWEHIEEIRRRTIVVLLSVLLFSIFGYFIFPYFVNFIIDIIQEKLYVTNITEGFLTKLRISVLIGLFLSIPILLFEIVLFISPALEKRKKIIMLLTMTSTFSLFVGGIIFALRSVLPISIQFLKSEVFFPNNINRIISYTDFIVFFFQFLFGFGICFQFPIIMIFLLKLNIITMDFLIKKSKYFIIIIFLLSAIITPPDIISQILLAIPMILLYSICILIGKLFKLGR